MYFTLAILSNSFSILPWILFSQLWCLYAYRINHNFRQKYPFSATGDYSWHKGFRLIGQPIDKRYDHFEWEGVWMDMSHNSLVHIIEPALPPMQSTQSMDVNAPFKGRSLCCLHKWTFKRTTIYCDKKGHFHQIKVKILSSSNTVVVTQHFIKWHSSFLLLSYV